MYRGLICLALGFVLMATQATSGGLVGQWKFDEGTGTTVGDSGPNGITGTIEGTALWTTGVYGGAIELDGNSWVTFGTPTQLQLPGPMTIACWVNPAIVEGEQSFATMETSYAFKASGTQIRFTTPGITDHTSSNVNLLVGEWQHVAATFQPGAASGAKFYYNAELASQTTASSLTAGGGPFRIGNNQWSQVFTGQLDEVCVYDRILNDAQLKSVMYNETPDYGKAGSPNPADGAIGISMALLQWSKGEDATSHNVYLGTSPDLTEADLKASHQALSVTFYYYAAGFVPGTTYYWRIDEVDKDGVTIHTGDTWSFVAQDVTAYYPTPADGSNTVLLAPTLTWAPGTGALGHYVYFGTDADAVSQGTAETDKGAVLLGEETFSPGTLDSLTTYYWRVDETVAGNTIKTGSVWSFTTALPFDDFESYTDDEGSRIYETWIDGYTNGTGMTVGNWDAPFAELTIVHDANQAMPLDYNNVDEPYYSEADREFTPAEDWTADDVNGLALYVRGRWGNVASSAYVAIEDSSGKVGIVTYPDQTPTTSVTWVEWKIPFSEFTAAGVNMARVKKLTIGVGDKANPQAGGTGRMYVDDILLTKP